MLLRRLCLLAAVLAPPSALAEPVLTQFHHGPDHLGVFTGASPGNLVKPLWSADLGGYSVASPVVADGVLYLGTRNGDLFALDVKTGARLWRFASGAGISATVAVAGGTVFFQNAANTVFAVGAKDGHEIWRRETGATLPFASGPPGFPEGANWDYWTASPLYDDGRVYIGSGDGRVYALDAASGAVRWSFATRGRVRSTPACDGKTIYVGSFDGALYALDAATGRQRWSFQTHGNPDFPVGAIQSSPALAGGLVLFGSRDYNLYALDAKSGKEVWRNFHKDSWVVATPAVVGGKVYVGTSDGHFLRAVDLATGAEVWTRATDYNVFASAAVIGDRLYVGTLGGTLQKMDLADGKGGGLILQERIYASPWIEDGVLYFATDDGVVYAQTNGVFPPPK